MMKISQDTLSDICNKFTAGLTKGTLPGFTMSSYGADVLRRLQKEEDSKIIKNKYNDALNAYNKLSEDEKLDTAPPNIEDFSAYPKTIKIARSAKEILAGDLTPAKEIVITEPLTITLDLPRKTSKGDVVIDKVKMPIWMSSSVKELYLRSGYIDGDARKIDNTKIAGTVVHGMLAGATGQGKSVTLTAIITMLLLTYGPWALNLTLADPKIVELGPYGDIDYTPHIRSVAATEDTDYVVSSLMNMVEEMTLINSAISKHGYRNIWEFEAGTGLILPRNLLVVDEFETLLSKSAKKMGLVIKAIEELVKMGRNSGYHILTASQNVPADMPSGVMKNIALRMAMGCDEDVSNIILGNNRAVFNKGLVGRLLVTTSAATKDPSNNVDIRVPYTSDDEKHDISKKLREKCKELGITKPLSVYDEKILLTPDKLREDIERVSFQEKSLYLGEPSFVLKDKYDVLRLELDGKGYETVCAIAPTSKEQCKLLYPLIECVAKFNDINSVIYLDEEFKDRLPLEKLNPKYMSSEDSFKTNPAYTYFINNYKNRVLAYEIESKILDYTIDTESDAYKIAVVQLGEIKTNLVNMFPAFADENIISDINVARYLVGTALIQTNEFLAKTLELSDITKETVTPIITMYFGMVFANKFGTTNFNVNSLPTLNLWLLDTKKFKGIGRNGSGFNGRFAQFADIIDSCKKYNTRVFMSTTTLEDMTELSQKIRWFLCTMIPSNEISKMKASDHYPDTVYDIQGLLYCPTASGDKCLKYKKLKFEDEI